MDRELLRPYQKSGSDFIVKRGRAYLADDPGLGKTLTTLDALHRIGVRPVLILAGTVGLYTWHNELRTWFDESSMIYTGYPYQRQKLWNEFCKSDTQYLITTYGMLPEILEQSKNKVKWNGLVEDEVHRAGILNRKTKTYQNSYDASSSIPIYVPLTGTPVRKNLADLWSVLHAINPRIFKSYWKFIQDHCIVTTVGFDTQIEARPKDPIAFEHLVSNFMLRRSKTDVLTDLPPKQRSPILVELNDVQRRIYNQLAEDMVAHDDTTGNWIITPNSVARITRFRQLLVCPRVLGIDDDGAAIEAIADQIDDLFVVGRPAVIFTPYAEALPHFEKYLKRRLGPVSVFKIQGGMQPREVNYVETCFQTMTDPRRIVICVIKSGTSFQLFKSSDCFFAGYEWSAIENTQAEDRLHRMGQQGNVTCWYPIHRGTIDDEIMLKLNDKTLAANWTLRPQDMLKRIKKI